MAHSSSLAHQTNLCGRGILNLNLATLESRPKILPMASRTLDGSSPQTDECTSCLSHLMHGCLTLPTSLLYLSLLPPLLISTMRLLGLGGMIVTVHSFPTRFVLPSHLFGYPLSLKWFIVLVFYLLLFSSSFCYTAHPS